jgi:hypothetical protein
MKGLEAREMPATEKQIRYAMFLLDKTGYGTNWMDARFKELGATMRERSGKVEDWVKSRTVSELSAIIDQLKKREGGTR